jgi:hypothetical protein
MEVLARNSGRNWPVRVDGKRQPVRRYLGFSWIGTVIGAPLRTAW